MKILLTAASSSSKLSGVLRHAFNAVRCLLQHPDVSAVHLVVAPWQQQLVQDFGLAPHLRLTTHIARMHPGSLSRNLWYYRQLPQLAAKLQPDLIHLSYPVPLHAAALSGPAVLTLHDLYPFEIPENFGFPKVLFNRLVLRQCLRNATAIACVSETTVLRLRQYFSRPICEKASRIYNCVEPQPLCSEVSPLPDSHGDPFLLCVAQHRRNKNIPLLIRAFHRLLHHLHIDPATKLVIVGITGPETARIRRLIADCNLGGHVLLLDGLSDPQLQWCYTHCDALIVPSKTEGFGLPVAEGLLAGCRILCADIPALREVGDPHCRFVSLEHAAEQRLAEEIAAILHTPRPAPLALPHLSAEVLGNEYISLYRRLISPETAQPIAEHADPVTENPSHPVALTSPIPSLSQSRRPDHVRL